MSGFSVTKNSGRTTVSFYCEPFVRCSYLSFVEVLLPSVGAVDKVLTHLSLVFIFYENTETRVRTREKKRHSRMRGINTSLTDVWEKHSFALSATIN